MLFNKKMIVAETQRGLLFKDEQFVQLLTAGVHNFLDWKNQYRVDVVDITNSLQNGVNDAILNLADLHSEAFADSMLRWETGEHEVGLVYQDNTLKDIKAPGQRGAYWLGQRQIEVRKADINTDYKLSAELARIVLAAKDALLRNAALASITTATVNDGHVGFLEVDGEAQDMLKSGVHVWWRFNRGIKVQHMDIRLQNMEVNGQEILTKDRVSLRINLSATWQVADAQKARDELADHQDYLYRELQLALRTVVSTQTLDELLADKNLLNQQVQLLVSDKAAEYGIQLKSVGARDIVLPGDMKMILAQVVEAEKLAEANLIKRREETQATRSLHNTAKVMEGNPTLLRLKELEVLEKVTSQINTLNVYGGLDGVMNDMIRMTDKTKAA